MRLSEHLRRGLRLASVTVAIFLVVAAAYSATLSTVSRYGLMMPNSVPIDAKVENGDTIVRSVRIWNHSSRSVNLQVEPMCGCTRPSWRVRHVRAFSKGSHCGAKPSGSGGTGLTCTDTSAFVYPYYMTVPCEQSWVGPVPNGCRCDQSSGTWVIGTIGAKVPTCACQDCHAVYGTTQ